MNNVIVWFELPVQDMERAKQFYTYVLNASFTEQEMACPEGTPFVMAFFNAEQGAVSGALVKGEHYDPLSKGAVVYFNGGADLAEPLERAVQQGAQVLIPKMPIEDGAKGYFAQLIDSEGNRIGLYSPPL